MSGRAVIWIAYKLFVAVSRDMCLTDARKVSIDVPSSAPSNIAAPDSVILRQVINMIRLIMTINLHEVFPASLDLSLTSACASDLPSINLVARLMRQSNIIEVVGTT